MEETHPSLLIRVRDPNDRKAWQEFFDLYSPLLYSCARERGLSHDDAEEIQSSCYETIIKSIQNFDYSKEKGGFRAWLRTMVNRRVIDLFRKKKMPNADSSDLNRVANEESADEIFERNWRLHHLRYCVEQVRHRVQPDTFEVFRQLTQEGAEVPDVCASMNMNEDQVYQIKSRVLKLVKQEMQLFDLD